MNSKTRKQIKVFGATSVTLFSLVTVFTATIAWFSMNSSLKATGMNFQVISESGRLNKIEIFEYVETLNKGGVSNFSFSGTASATIYGGDEDEDDYFLMGDYNPLHVDHPVLILFTLKDGFVSTTAGDMYISGFTETPGFLGATKNGAPVYKLGDVTSSDSPGTLSLKCGEKDIPVNPENPDGPTKTVDCYPLSSAVNFKCAHYSSDDYDLLLAASTTGRIDIPTGSIELKQSFVNFATTGTGITFINDPTIYQSPGGNKSIQYVAMVVNYDGNAISAIYSTYLGNPTLENDYGGSFYFTCDWVLEVF